MKARVVIMLKKSVLDPQGQAVSRALVSLGFDEVKEVRLGKLIEMELGEGDPKKARERLAQMCEKLLANLIGCTKTIEAAVAKLDPPATD